MQIKFRLYLLRHCLRTLAPSLHPYTEAVTELVESELSQTEWYCLSIANCWLPIAKCWLPIANCWIGNQHLAIDNQHLAIGNQQLAIGNQYYSVWLNSDSILTPSLPPCTEAVTELIVESEFSQTAAFSIWQLAIGN